MTEKDNTKADSANTDKPTGKFVLQKVYVKDISFETPNAPDIFLEKWNPKVDMNLFYETRIIKGDLTEVNLGITITAKISDKTAYLVEVKIAGIFMIQEFPPEIIEQITATTCPNMLFPFARELICDLVTRGGFPQLLLAPVNFEAIYAEQKKRVKEQSSVKNDSKTTH
ncbi:MAG: protein-export chaperone SecB [Gammaproteobacteria bacterium]